MCGKLCCNSQRLPVQSDWAWEDLLESGIKKKCLSQSRFKRYESEYFCIIFKRSKWPFYQSEFRSTRLCRSGRVQVWTSPDVCVSYCSKCLIVRIFYFNSKRVINHELMNELQPISYTYTHFLGFIKNGKKWLRSICVAYSLLTLWLIEDIKVWDVTFFIWMNDGKRIVWRSMLMIQSTSCVQHDVVSVISGLYHETPVHWSYFRTRSVVSVTQFIEEAKLFW